MIEIDRAEVAAEFEYVDGWLYRRAGSLRGRRAGCLKRNGYVVVGFNGRYYEAHRLIWTLLNGATTLQVDHINGVRSDNRIENLRACTQAQNQRCRKAVWGAIPLKGVTRRKGKGGFIAQIGVGDRRFYLGRYDTPEEAHQAYVAAARKHFGDFAEAGAH